MMGGMTTQTRQVQITGSGAGPTRVIVDGVDLAAHLQGLTLTMDADKVPALTLEVTGDQGVEYTGPALLTVEPTELQVRDAVLAFLTDMRDDAGLEPDAMSRTLDVTAQDAWLDALADRARAHLTSGEPASA
jgi:hypothetical protein